MHDPRLSFLVAGVQKAGTTALSSYLARHPELQPPVRKELHVFDADEALGPAPLDAAIEAFFPPADGRLRFDATPVTLYWPAALERVRAYRADMRLILLLRDPAERAFSHWRMEKARGLESEAFGWCIRQGRARFLGAHRVYSYVERGFYGAQVSRALSLFSRDQLLTLRSESLKRQPAACLRRITDFLGVSPFNHVQPRIVRPQIPEDHDLPLCISEADRNYLRLLYKEDQQRLEALVDPVHRASA